MTTKQLLKVLALGGLATAMSCDGGSSGASSDLSNNDCPIGTFRPLGLADCVFPASDQFGNAIGVSDNRCVVGQPATPPTCVSTAGERAYLAASTSCASGYSYEPGTCDRNGGTAGFGTAGELIGAAGFAEAGGFGVAGVSGQDGFGQAGAAGTFFGDAGASGTFNDGIGGGSGGASGGAGGIAGASGATMNPVDASADASVLD